MVLLGIHALLAWLARSPAILTIGDDAKYLLLARSLRALRYSSVWEIGQPAHLDYPPVYPLALSLWGSLVGDNYDLLLLLNVCASVAALAVLFLVVSRLWSPWVGLFALASVFANPSLVAIVGVLRPESLYMFLSIAAVAASSMPMITRAGPLAGAAAVGAALTRPTGVALVPSILMHWLLERRYRAAAVFAGVSTLVVGGWLYLTLVAPRGGGVGTYRHDMTLGMEVSFLSSLSGLFRRSVDHVAYYLGRALPQGLGFPAVQDRLWDNLLFGGGLILLGSVGLYVLYRRWRPAALYLLAYGSILAFWPWQSSRFLVPIMPLAVVAALLGIGNIAGLVSSRWKTPAAAMLALSFAVAGSTSTVGLLERTRGCQSDVPFLDSGCVSADQRSYFQALDYIATELPPEAVLFSSRPEPIYLYADRVTISRIRGLAALYASGPSDLEPLKAEGATHVLLSHLHGADSQILELLASRCSHLTLVARFEPRALLFQLGDDPIDQPFDDACAALQDYRESASDPETGQLRRDFRAEWPPG